MTARRTALLLVAPLLLAGCLASGAPAPDEGVAAGTTGPLHASAEPLWWNPQTFPHPAFNYATLSNPAVGGERPAWWEPIPAAALPAHIEGLAHAGGTGSAVTRGAGIALFGSLAVVPGYSRDTSVLDISEPTKPTLLSTIPGRHRGAEVIAYPDGRLVSVFATSRTVEVWNLTDPRAPEQLPTLEPRGGSHKVGVVPGTPIVYNANSDGERSQIEIFDLTEPEAPVHVQDLDNGYGCHHVYFYNDPARGLYRSLCAGVEATQILDTTDPRDPVVVATIPMPHGLQGVPATAVSPAHFSHFSILNADASVLVVGDETGGGLLAACTARAEAGALTFSGPTGALWFYDVSDETEPRLLGWFSPNHHLTTANRNPLAACTAHHGRLVPDPEGRDLLAMAYYGAGVLLVDFTDPANARLVDQWNQRASTWEAWYYNGYVFTGDLNRGLDVLRFE